ncbi:TPA: metal ABC transporter permease [Candidatus Gracilibacteria bacterium]|nr:metal ABC transporter permease [Candidatus Gracilibacteria bacterium]
MEIFTYDFMLRAFIIGGLSAILTSFLGNFLVASRQSMISDMLAHSSLAGVGMGIFFHISPYFTAMVISIIASSLLFFLTRGKKNPPEAISMMLLTGGVALALLFSHLAKDNPVSLETFLFGSILTTTTQEIYIFSGIFAGGILFILFFWKRLIGIFFNKDFTHSQYKNSWILEWIFFVLLGVVVAFSLKTIGALLIGALLVIPVLTAQIFAKRFMSSILLSMIINLLGVCGGIMISFYADIPSSSSVVLTLIVLFLVGNGIRFIFQKYQKID